MKCCRLTAASIPVPLCCSLGGRLKSQGKAESEKKRDGRESGFSSVVVFLLPSLFLIGNKLH